MSARRPFRFIAPMPPLSLGMSAWRSALRRIEDLGFSTVSISDHFVHGWAMDPLATLAAAAMATSRLRLLTLVLSNDYRHPVVLHKSAATIDVLSEGRLELGIGAGWLAEDYQRTGLPLETAGIRIARLEESLQVLRALFSSTDVTFAGRHYQLDALPGLPAPVQRPHPPLLIGGGGPRMLRLAATYADIVGVHLALPTGAISADSVADLAPKQVRAKVELIRSAAAAAGRAPDDLELQFTAYHVAIGGTKPASAKGSSFSRLLASDPSLASSPAVLVGDVDRCVDLLQQRRDMYGFSYWSLGRDVDALAPLVARLTDT